MRKIVFDIETTTKSPRNYFEMDNLEVSVVCIWNSEDDAFSSYFVEDLPKLWPIMERAELLIGFNSDHFDIPILNKYYTGDLTKIRSLDLLKEVKDALGRRIRLNSIAEATLGTSKLADGLKAVEWWKKGLKDKVVEYCIEDVRITRDVYNYALQNGLVKYKELGQIKEIKLDTSKWEAPLEQGAMTHTLPF
jgi:DEAD/DEAH box helicase domain-containing protein